MRPFWGRFSSVDLLEVLEGAGASSRQDFRAVGARPITKPWPEVLGSASPASGPSSSHVQRERRGFGAGAEVGLPRLCPAAAFCSVSF